MARLGTRPDLTARPTAVINVPASAVAGTTVLFSQTGSSDLYGPYTVFWNPGDGGAVMGPFNGVTGNTTYVFHVAGTYTVTLSVISTTTAFTDVATSDIVILPGAAPLVIRTSLSVLGLPWSRFR
jgi:PKD repeat protein